MCWYNINTPSKRFACRQKKFFKNILFHFSKTAVLSEPIFGWEVPFVLFSKTPYIAQSKGLRSGLEGVHKETPIILEVFGLGSGVKKIIGSLSFLSLLTNHHHHVMPLARISLTLSLHFSLSFIASGRSSGLHPVSSYSCCMYVRAGRPAFARPY